ncbi:hypothetical protein A7985_09005 [Pseudoalteromonas luteoviolacea]|uniref:PD(D/E)XK endonuclease domain-containing protein n=1 Tax=Pseudoalteromonas luteoviolacea TaxID=43657 RepID=A0A1C0TRS9_9GAMM|nr:hypothetical protein [Pseudoalteromonas luteoviolacea]OCQ21937.1 hypothetical protein A7985_09005 [Pseudoalteromonas luteoviolacea]
MNKHSENSSYREKLIEHLFIGELLKLSWREKDCRLEVGKPEIGNSYYDVILQENKVVRHVQLKASFIGSKTSRQNVNLKLADKPSGCIIWIYFDEESLKLGPYYFFGDIPGQPLPSLSDANVAKHTKGNQEGVKTERPNLRVLNKGNFKIFDTIEQLYEALFEAKKAF